LRDGQVKRTQLTTVCAQRQLKPGEKFMSSPVTRLTLENVLYEKKAAIAYVTVNRPKVLNALNQGTWADLRTAFEDARDDSAVRGVIVTGAGHQRTSAGHGARS
jgi:1,4-dihydroxy-2-naphthoyl-CoA synthase